MNNSIHSIISDIQTMKFMATDIRSDGWTQNYWREQLIAIKNEISKIPEDVFKLHGEDNNSTSD